MLNASSRASVNVDVIYDLLVKAGIDGLAG
jgi:hypothetical protein